jgi:hypothetical protein
MHIAGKETRALRRESRRLSFRSVAVDEVLCRVRSVYTHLPKLRWVSCLADADVRNQARQSRSCFCVWGGGFGCETGGGCEAGGGGNLGGAAIVCVFSYTMPWHYATCIGPRLCENHCRDWAVACIHLRWAVIIGRRAIGRSSIVCPSSILQ